MVFVKLTVKLNKKFPIIRMVVDRNNFGTKNIY